ncbi:hypothetical protein EDE04_0128 [Streptomyces sp. 2132.2]|uniref:hypothetical protein n=1 Tax=Streptomyces sp. 2132.2 TaxID=2485161 RepID=UPI000F47E757|nr:hypothetical protein [Streptomyces sp. 2132.2]ROQ93725.1 hypothetical protein EDE04_0128 [Streptomyces sp. 2132.2]
MIRRLRRCSHAPGAISAEDQAVVFDQFADTTAVALSHPDTGHAAARLHGRQFGYTDFGWLCRETTAILSGWQPAYAMLVAWVTADSAYSPEGCFVDCWHSPASATSWQCPSLSSAWLSTHRLPDRGPRPSAVGAARHSLSRPGEIAYLQLDTSVE